MVIESGIVFETFTVIETLVTRIGFVNNPWITAYVVAVLVQV